MICGWMYRLVGGWVGSCQITNNRINLELIEIISILCEDLRLVHTV